MNLLVSFTRIQFLEDKTMPSYAAILVWYLALSKYSAHVCEMEKKNTAFSNRADFLLLFL